MNNFYQKYLSNLLGSLHSAQIYFLSLAWPAGGADRESGCWAVLPAGAGFSCGDKPHWDRRNLPASPGREYPLADGIRLTLPQDFSYAVRQDNGAHTLIGLCLTDGVLALPLAMEGTAYMNLKKLANRRWESPDFSILFSFFFHFQYRNVVLV